MEHYFSASPSSKKHTQVITALIDGTYYKFTTAGGVFSKDRVDRGTMLLVESVGASKNDKILDLGCGYGVVGIVLSKYADSVLMTDINERAVELAKTNVKLNGAGNVEVVQCDLYEGLESRKFDKIICNPPIRAGRAVVRKIIEGAPAHLVPGGSLYLVVQTRQGAKSIAKIMKEIFGNQDYVKKSGGYRVIVSRLAA